MTLSKFWWLLTVAGGVYVLIGVVLVAFQSKLVFVPDRANRGTPASIGLAFERVTLKTPDGERLAAWYVPAKSARATILFCHGNAGNISDRLESIRIFRDLGLSVLIFDYRGYGDSTGNPTEQGTYIDAQTAWDYLTGQLGVPPGEIVVFGRSLGAAIAAKLAGENKPGGLILESPFTSVSDVAQEIYRIFPARLLTWIRYDTSAALGRIRSPVLIVHSRDDDIIPFHHGRALFEQARDPKMFLEIVGGHNDGFAVSGARYSDGLKRFMDRYMRSGVR